MLVDHHTAVSRDIPNDQILFKRHPRMTIAQFDFRQPLPVRFGPLAFVPVKSPAQQKRVDLPVYPFFGFPESDAASDHTSDRFLLLGGRMDDGKHLPRVLFIMDVAIINLSAGSL